MKYLIIFIIFFTSSLLATEPAKKEFFNWGYFQEDVQKSILVRKVTYNKRYQALLVKEEEKTITKKEIGELHSLKIFFKKNPKLLMDLK